MTTVLHLSYDYCEQQNAPVTTAVADLIEQTQQVSAAQVVRLARVPSFQEEEIMLLRAGHLRIKTFGLPYGIFLLAHLQRVFQKILIAHNRGMLDLGKTDVIHAHKLTFEGYPGLLLAKKLGCPLFVSLRQTDFMVLKYRPDLHPLIRDILEESVTIFYIAPFMKEAIQKHFCMRFFEKHIQPKLVFLPNIVRRTNIVRNAIPLPGRLLTVLRMTPRSVKRKNIKHLLTAFKMCRKPAYHLDVIGGGPCLDTVKRWSEKLGIARQVSYLGEIPNQAMDSHYATAGAFLMPSYSETFGIAYAEALLNGTPILYSRGTGFDGIFEGVGVCVDPTSCREICRGITDLVENNRAYRQTIKTLMACNAFSIFSPEYTREVYKKCLEKKLPLPAC